jgi:hypothetical protein
MAMRSSRPLTRDGIARCRHFRALLAAGQTMATASSVHRNADRSTKFTMVMTPIGVAAASLVMPEIASAR